MNPLFRLVLVVLFFFSASSAFAACDELLPLTGARDDILVVVNDNSLDSCEVGRYYAEKRGLGQNNIAHIAAPASYWLTWDEFRNMMDQLIKYMQDNTLVDGAPPAPVCSDGITPYYCQASMDHLAQYNKIRYIVMTRGVPTRSPIAGSTLWFPTETTSVDNYVSYWLARYFPDNNADGHSDDVTLSFSEREIAFGDGRGMRTVAPAADGELIVGRIDGVNLEATKALIDRIIDVENNGMFGKNYGARFGRLSGRAQWWDFSTNSLVYGTSAAENTGDAWRYQLGIFGESRPECIDYLNFSSGSAEGKAPQYCSVRISDSTPGVASSRTPIADDAVVYFGSLQGQSSMKGSFNTMLNWVKNTSCTVKLCDDAADPAACRAASTDAYKELNTDCVGVGDGFIGYNYQSFPVSYMTEWPTGWRGPNGGSQNNLAFPEVRTDIGQDDLFSLWFRNTDSVALPLCYADADFSASPAVPCRDQRIVSLYRYMNFTAVPVDTANPQQYQISFWYKASNITEGDNIRVSFRVYQPTSRTWVNYGNATVASFPVGETDWSQAQLTVTLAPALHTDTDLLFSQIEVRFNTGTYTGELGFDNFSMQEVGVGTEMLTNTSFTEGWKQVSGGDHAAVYLSRLNGVGFWGSASHHQSGGHSFANNSQETLIYFLRGLPLGDAVWWGEQRNSGLFYGDPVYSPAAVRLDYTDNIYDYVTGIVPLSGSAVNGRDGALVDTQFAIDYCPGSDFYVCDQNGSWAAAGLSGAGGQENMAFGDWDTSTLALGEYTLRLAVASTNAGKGRTQTLYDYYPVVVYDPAADNDTDGLNNGAELQTHGTDPNDADTDNDGLSDGDEVNLHGTSPTSSHSDSDTLPDGWEVDNGTDPLADDGADDPDGDGLNNLQEFSAQTNPNDPDTDGDGLNDGDEVNIHGTSPRFADTDGDRLTDSEEINLYGTDPLSAIDSDVDKMADDWESVRGTDPLVDDARVDADGDGVDNVIEYLYATLPLDAASAPDLQTWYVDIANTSGVEDGSAANPFSTLVAAVTASSHGDTILVAPGSYSTGFWFYSTYVRIVGSDPAEVTLDTTGFLQLFSSWGSMENMTIRTVGNVLNLYGARNFLLRNTVLSADNGVVASSGARVLIENSVLANPLATFGVQVDGSSELQLTNSVVDGFASGVLATAVGAGVLIRNSILTNTLDLDNVTDGSGISYSLISDGQFTGANNNISADPLYMDAANGDYRLLAGSPGIDAGDPADAWDAEPEPNGCRINMGAWGNTAQAEVSAEDPDGDGLYGYCEVRAGTDPNHADSDHDGLLDGAEVSSGDDPLNLFSPAGEGMNLAADAGFTLQGSAYLSTDTLHILAWSEIVGASAGTASYTVTGGATVLSGSLTDEGDGSYSGVIALADLNYVGNDVLVDIRLQERKRKYIDERVISVSGDANTVPVVDISAPSDGSSFDSGVSVAFAGSATDAEDGDLTASLTWTSSLDGVIGTGGGFSVVLSDGVHSITASVTDSGGRVGNEVLASITVGAVAEPITLTANGYKVKGKQNVDLAWSGAPGASVDIYRDGALLVTTANDGAYTDAIGAKGSATYLYAVCEAGTSNCSANVSVVF